MAISSSVGGEDRVVQVTLREWGEMCVTVERLDHVVGLLQARHLVTRRLIAGVHEELSRAIVSLQDLVTHT